MFCKNCGKEIDDKASVCIYCGVSTSYNESNVLAIVGFVLSFFISIAGLVCSILGYKRAHEFGGKGKNLAFAGIIISMISMAIALIYVVWLIAGIAAIV